MGDSGRWQTPRVFYILAMANPVLILIRLRVNDRKPSHVYPRFPFRRPGTRPPLYRCTTLWAALALAALAALPARAQGVPVSVETAQRMPVYRQVALTGTVTPLRSASLSAATSGLVQALNVDAGSRVERGDLLLELDPELAALQLESAEAQEVQAREALEDARRRLREARELIPQRSIAESVVRDLEAEVAGDEAALRRATADAGYQRALLERHRVRAPFTGVVSARHTDLGEWVTPGQAVLDLVATEAVRLDFPVSEDYLSSLRPGARVDYHLNASPELRHRGEVDALVPVTDPGARTFLLRVAPEPDSPPPMPGMSVRATLQLATGREGLVISRDATVRYPDGRTVVWTVEPGDDGPRAVENRVETGLQFDGKVEIRRGLSPGAKVVVRGNEALQADQPVEVSGNVTLTEY